MALPTRKDRQLLAYLALQGGRPQSREKLASLLWADRAEEQARDSLRQSLSALRRAFRAVGVDPIASDRSQASLDQAIVTTDVATFSEGCIGAAPSADLARLYRGPFLEGLDASTPDFERWVSQERQRLATLAEQLVCTAAISVLPAGDSEAALQLGRRLLAEDPTLESVYRSIMRLCQARGDRVAALKAYATCRDTLRDELGVEPDHETERLYRDILTEGAAGPSTPVEVLGDATPSKPSIAIIPFANLTGTESLNFLCDGLAEEVSTGLGRFRSLFVIDRYSAAMVASATSDTAEIGRRLGAAALVQGSIQANNSRLRITVRLVDSANRAQTWSDVFECTTGDVPGIPDQIVSAIIATVHNRAEHTVIDRVSGTPSMQVYELTMRGIKHLRGYAADDNAKALALFRDALIVDPTYALAQAYLAFAEIVANDYDNAPRGLLIDCKTRIDQALANDPDDGRIRLLLARVHGYLLEFDAERRQLERALALNPNDANARAAYGIVLTTLGEHDSGIRHVGEAMRINPFHPEWYWVSLGDAFLAARRYADAIEAYKRRTRPFVWVMTRLAICHAHLGQDSEAREVTQRILELNPEFRISTLRRGAWSGADVAHMQEGMRLAGLPE